ncbi:MAG: glycogen debranching protein GlgX [Chloroflexaceae bacterium]|nr:glycogen debranching protein GlgX [Chloroflexaceae bacterium]
MIKKSFIDCGQSFPLGATIHPGGVNFSVFSKHATTVELLLFDRMDDGQPARVLQLDPKRHRTFHYWHMFVPGVKAGQLYGYRVDGPRDPANGMRFDYDKVLLDPYGKGVATGPHYSREAASKPGDTAATSMKSVVVDPSTYDWEDDHLLQRSFADTVIYEMHVRGFTRHPSSGLPANMCGTYAGVVEKIPYLLDLGITAVELMPVMQFDEQSAPPGLTNYWGYDPVSFFAPHMQYSSCVDPLGAINEFRDMVKALHRAGIEVILDVVYNHTAEGNHLGPTFSFRGFENRAYYILEENPTYYANYTGTGNTLNANQSVVRRLIMDSLRYWVQEMHVDGFRFDLASILMRDEWGHPLKSPPILWEIESDPVLAGCKLIAEAWDAAGLYQVGSFIGDRWKEWNGRFRDDVRSFVKGEAGALSALPARLLASPDLYEQDMREAEQSINFVTAHDGFTLNDLVSYNEKHNEANNEGNRDGHNDNRSWNHGVEGPTDDPAIEALRNRQVKNFFTIMLLSIGCPMLLMGDEVRRTQQGNNNSYCQDNAISWFDWRNMERHGDIYRFVKELNRFRLSLDRVKGDYDLTLADLLHQAQVQWHGTTLNEPDWGENSHSLALTVRSLTGTRLIHMIFNAYWDALTFELPAAPGSPQHGWRRVVDTFREPPEDICDWEDAPMLTEPCYEAQPRSVIVLVADVPAE